MGLVLRIMVLAGLIKYVEADGKPVHCGIIYFIIKLLTGIFFGSIYGQSLISIIISSLIVGGLSYLYFYIISKTGGIIYWITLIFGALILFI